MQCNARGAAARRTDIQLNSQQHCKMVGMASRSLLHATHSQPRTCTLQNAAHTRHHIVRLMDALTILTLLACLGAARAITLPSMPCDAMSSPPLLETGSIPIAHNASMFFWLVRSPDPSPKQPVGLWFHGVVPRKDGCASEFKTHTVSRWSRVQRRARILLPAWPLPICQQLPVLRLSPRVGQHRHVDGVRRLATRDRLF